MKVIRISGLCYLSQVLLNYISTLKKKIYNQRVLKRLRVVSKKCNRVNADER